MTVDAAAPQSRHLAETFGGEFVKDRVGRHKNTVALAIEAPEMAFDRRTDEACTIKSGVGFEPGVQAGDEWHVQCAREALRG